MPLSLLLKEAGVQNAASWIVAEGAEEVKGASSIPLAKAMDDCLVCYAQNGEPIRPQQGFPLRLMVPGFEGIYQIKYLRRIKVVDRYYMTYDDYGHINPDPKVAALTHQIGPKSVITFPSGGQQLSGPGFYEISGLAWSGAGAIRGVEISTDGGQSWKNAELRSPAYPMAHTRFGFHWKWDGKECVLMSRCTDELGTVQPTRAEVAKYWNEPLDKVPDSRRRQYRSTVEGRERWERSQWACLELLLVADDPVGICQTAWTQSPTYGVGRTPTRGRNPRLGYRDQPDGKGAPARAGDCQRRRGALRPEGLRGMPRGNGIRRPCSHVDQQRKGASDAGLRAPCLAPCVNDSNTMAIHSPFATTIWDYINRGMPLGKEGTLTPNEVYALTAFLLYKNDVIKEDEVMDAQSLPKVKMPNRMDLLFLRSGSTGRQGFRVTHKPVDRAA